MPQGIEKNMHDGFTQEEKTVIAEFMSGKSIRTIAKSSNLGRTAIKNVLNMYKKVHPEFAEEIDNRLLENRNHKKVNGIEIQELSYDEVAKIFNEIMNSEITLSQASLNTGRNRDYIKKKIYAYLNGNEVKVKEFEDKLKQNQLSLADTDSLRQFFGLTIDGKKEIIFEKLNSRRAHSGKKPYNDSLLEKKFQRIEKYFLETRNSKFEEQVLTEEDFWKMLYDTPSLLAYSLSDRVDPAMRNLDRNEHIGPKNATKIVVEDASILASSIPRTNLQIQMLVDYDMLELFLKKPRYFRTSPELIYGLAKFAEERGYSKSDTLLTDSQLKSKYGVSTEELKQKYNPAEKYGDYEYFDK